MHSKWCIILTLTGLYEQQLNYKFKMPKFVSLKHKCHFQHLKISETFGWACKYDTGPKRDPDCFGVQLEAYL